MYRQREKNGEKKEKTGQKSLEIPEWQEQNIFLCVEH